MTRHRQFNDAHNVVWSVLLRAHQNVIDLPELRAAATGSTADVLERDVDFFSLELFVADVNGTSGHKLVSAF